MIQVGTHLSEYFVRVQEIAIYLCETMWKARDLDGDVPKDFLVSRDGVNPYYGKIEPNGGIGLEFYYGTPCYHLLTPLGYLSVGGTVSGRVDLIERYVQEISERLALVEIEPVRLDNMGEYGPVFSIGRDLRGNELPRAVRLREADSLTYVKAIEIWKSVRPEGRNA